MTAKPIDFVYDFETDSYDLSRFSSDADILEVLQQGRTESTIFKNTDDIIFVNQIFGGTFPEVLHQNPVTGRNNIQSATAALYQFHAWTDYIQRPKFRDDGTMALRPKDGKPKMEKLSQHRDWTNKLQQLIEELNDEYQFIKIGMQNLGLDQDTKTA